MRGLGYLAIFLLLALPLATATAQRPAGGLPPPPERLPLWEHNGRSLEARPLGPPETAGRTEAAHPTSLNWHIEQVDTGKIVYDPGSRRLALDTFGRPHIAYGGDHLYYAWHDGNAWHLETVDASSGVGEHTSLALDGSDRPHISYHDDTNDDLKYAHFDGTCWLTETVDSTGVVGEYTSLALDAAGHPHISYHDGYPNYNLKYAHFDGSTWLTETIDSAGWVGSYTSLALDAAGHPHISYEDSYPNFDLKYIHFDGSAWLTETVDSAGDVGKYTSLALDANDHPHISYYDFTNRDLKYAHLDGSAWLTETVDSAGWVGDFTSLALDTSDNPHISYYGSDLKYAHFDGSAWLTETVDSARYVGYYTSLALDSSDNPHISYYSHLDLKYAHFDGSAWLTETVDSAGTVGRFTSLALDANDHPHISYYDGTNGDLKYAHFDGSFSETAWRFGKAESHGSGLGLRQGWLVETVDSAEDVGYYTSLALDGMGRPHISYCLYNPFASACDDLNYAHFDGTFWLTETVDSTGDVGSHTSLALDASDNPRISYYDETNDDLKYAHFDGISWQVETVDSAGDVGWFTSLALDASDNPHISYYDETNSDLKYARFDGISWLTETVDSAGDAGGYTSLALDGMGRPHISYCLYGTLHRVCGNLKYAHFDGISWQVETVDGGGHVGYDTSLALDASDNPHISYEDSYPNFDLRYAHFDGTSWQVQTVDSGGHVGYDTSLALDAAGRPHISYYDYTNNDLKYAWGECVPLTGASIEGPAVLPVGQTGLYTATTTPPTATAPLTFTWDSGAIGASAAYSWIVPGSYTLTVTATNPCGTASASFTVEVFCQPLEGLDLTGPGALLVEQEGAYRAAPLPITASLPLTFTWDSGAVGPTAVYSWPATGAYTITVTGTNLCGGEAVGQLPVQLLAEWPYQAYLPLLLRGW